MMKVKELMTILGGVDPELNVRIFVNPRGLMDRLNRVPNGNIIFGLKPDDIHPCNSTLLSVNCDLLNQEN